MDILLPKTGSKTIVECASDRLWGTGIPLNDPTCLDPQKWINQGIMGQILEGIHNEALQIQQQQQQYPLLGSAGSSSNMINTKKLPRSPLQHVAPIATNAMASNYSASVTDPVSSHVHRSLPLLNNEQTCLADEIESGSASITPVSNTTETTSSDAEPGEVNQCQSERQTSAMEESDIVALPSNTNKSTTASIN